MLHSATIADLAVVASWIRSPSECELWAGWRVTFPIDVAALPGAIGFTDTNAFCLMDGQQIVGFGQLVMKDTTRGHLARVIVNPTVRGRGYGEALVRNLCEVGRARDCHRLSLHVADVNQVAIDLYRKLGFTDAPRPAGEPAVAGTRYLERPA